MGQKISQKKNDIEKCLGGNFLKTKKNSVSLRAGGRKFSNGRKSIAWFIRRTKVSISNTLAYFSILNLAYTMLK